MLLLVSLWVVPFHLPPFPPQLILLRPSNPSASSPLGINSSIFLQFFFVVSFFLSFFWSFGLNSLSGATRRAIAVAFVASSRRMMKTPPDHRRLRNPAQFLRTANGNLSEASEANNKIGRGLMADRMNESINSVNQSGAGGAIYRRSRRDRTAAHNRIQKKKQKSK